jgi:hypothetical protein
LSEPIGPGVLRIIIYFPEFSTFHSVSIFD